MSQKEDVQRATATGKQKAFSPSIDIEASFQGVGLALSQFDQERQLDIARVEILGAQLKYCKKELETLIKFDLARIALANSEAEADSTRFQNIFAPCSSVSEKVVALELITSGNPVGGTQNQELKVELSRFILVIDELFVERIVEYIENFAQRLTASFKSEVSVEKLSYSTEFLDKTNVAQEVKSRFFISLRSGGFEVLLPSSPRSKDGLHLQIHSVVFQSTPASGISESTNTITSSEAKGEEQVITATRHNISFSVDIQLLQNSMRTSSFEVKVAGECIYDGRNNSESLQREIHLKVALQTCKVVLRVQDIEEIELIATKQRNLTYKLFVREKAAVHSVDEKVSQSEQHDVNSSTTCLDLDLAMEELSVALQGEVSNTKKTLGSEPLLSDECAELSTVLSQLKFTYEHKSGMSCSSQSANFHLCHVAVKFGSSARKTPSAGKKHCFPNVLVSALLFSLI